MPATIQGEPTKVCLPRISGALKRSELGAKQDVLPREIDAGSKSRIWTHYPTSNPTPSSGLKRNLALTRFTAYSK